MSNLADLKFFLYSFPLSRRILAFPVKNLRMFKLLQVKKDIEKDTGKDYYMSSKEAKEYGIIDDIIKK